MPAPTFRPGFEYVIRSRQTLTTVLAAGLPGAGEQVAEVALEVVATCRAVPGAAGRRQLSIRLARVEMNVRMGGLTMTYDSAEPGGAETVLGQTFQNAIGKSFQLILGPDDQVIETRGAEVFSAASSPLGQQVGVEQLTQVAMPMLALGVPKGGVKPGQSWEHVKNSSLGPAGKLQAAYQVTYVGDRNGEAAFRYQAQLRPALETAEGGKEAASRIAIGNGTLSGTVQVDPSRGFPTAGCADGSLTMSLPAPGDPAQTLQLPITQRRSFELVRMRAVE